MGSNQRGHAAVEMIMLTPVIIMVLTLVWIIGEYMYVKHRTVLASKCLALVEKERYVEDTSPGNDWHDVDVNSILGDEFFEGGGSEFSVPSDHGGAPGDARSDNGGHEYYSSLLGIVESIRGATTAICKVEYKPVLFWPDNRASISDTLYLAASDWRYAELEGGYTGWIGRLLSDKLGGLFGDFFD